MPTSSAAMEGKGSRAASRVFKISVAILCFILLNYASLANSQLPMFMSSLYDGAVTGQILRPEIFRFFENIDAASGIIRLLLLIVIIGNLLFRFRSYVLAIPAAILIPFHVYYIQVWIEIVDINLADLFVFAQRESIAANVLFLLFLISVVLFAVYDIVSRQAKHRRKLYEECGGVDP